MGPIEVVPSPSLCEQRRAGAEIIRVLLDADADQHLTTDDGTTPFMAAAGLGRSTFRPNQTRGTRSPGAEEAVKVLLEAGADINATNEADFTALHGAAFRGLNEVVEYLVAHDADIDARDFRGRTPFRLAEGSKQSFQFKRFRRPRSSCSSWGPTPGWAFQERYKSGRTATSLRTSSPEP